jgi:hypothetical protein
MSACVARIFADALKDDNWAIIVGDGKTHDKATVHVGFSHEIMAPLKRCFSMSFKSGCGEKHTESRGTKKKPKPVDPHFKGRVHNRYTS